MFAPWDGLAGRRVRRGPWFLSSTSPDRHGFRRCVRTASDAGRFDGWTIPDRSASRSRVPDRLAARARRPDEAPEYWRPIVRLERRRVSSNSNLIPEGLAVDMSGRPERPHRRRQPGRQDARIRLTARLIGQRRHRAGPRRTARPLRHGAPRRSPRAHAAEVRRNGHPNWVAVCRHITSAANCPLPAARWAADSKTAIASLTAPWPAATHARARLSS